MPTKCNRCPRKCSGIGRGFIGFCGVVVVDDDGVRDKYPWMVTAVTVSMIEKIPLYHFYPGVRSLNLWVPGCPYTCNNCPWGAVVGGEDVGKLYDLRVISIEKILDYYNHVNAKIVSVLGGEPLVQEWVVTLLDELKNKNVKTVVKTTLSVSRNILEKLHVDAILIDLPLLAGSIPLFSDVIENISIVDKKNIHYEILLSIDNTSMLKWPHISEKLSSLGKDTPIHLQITEPVNWKTIRKLIDILEHKGFNYIYVVGDTSGEYTTTYCPKCKSPVIIRDEYGLREVLLDNNKCPKCGLELKIIGGYTKGKQRRISRLLGSGERILWSP